MRINVKVHGVLRKAAKACDGPIDLELGTTIGTLLHLLGLDGVGPTLIVMNERVARLDDPLESDADVSVFARVSGG